MMFTETLVRERIATLHDEAERSRPSGRNGRPRRIRAGARRPIPARGF